MRNKIDECRSSREASKKISGESSSRIPEHCTTGEITCFAQLQPAPGGPSP